jgi:copper chaperone NosL
VTQLAFPERGRLRLLAVVALPCLATLAACGREVNTGPAEIKWDRDVCEHCGMIISDRHYAAEIRVGPKHKVHKFDDIGCAVTWLKEHPSAQAPGAEIWVNDYRNSEWLDARRAHYVSGRTTPMGYGFGAVKEATPEAVQFVGMESRVLAQRH